MTNDQLWGAVLLALGVFQAFWLYRELESGNWSSLWGGWRSGPNGTVPILSADRRSHPIFFWIGVAWDAFAMVMLAGLGAYDIAPLVLRVLGK